MEKWAKGDMKRTREPSRWRQKGSSRARAQESEPSPPSPSPAQLQQTCLLLPVPRGTVPASLKVWDEGHLLNEGRDRERGPASAPVPTLVSSRLFQTKAQHTSGCCVPPVLVRGQNASCFIKCDVRHS